MALVPRAPKKGSPDFHCDWPGNERVQIGTMRVQRIVWFSCCCAKNEHMDQLSENLVDSG